MNKETSKCLKDSITKILSYYDPVKLGGFGVPKNEYVLESEAIISKLRDADDIRSLKWMIYDVFTQFFSKENILRRSDKCYQFIAEEIWDVWQEAIVTLES